ncbi:MAG: HAD family phosphatase [Lachnospiraceae bacterium]|nr:HAD family phosphatase [Lachnospiraceae bacterium]
MIKLIVSDIDGTLLEDGNNELNPELLEVIVKLRKQGMQFAAASGRQWVSIERTFDMVKEKIFYLSDNGAYVGLHGRNLYLNTIEPKIVWQMVRDIRKEGLIPLVSGPDILYIDEGDLEFYDWLVKGYQFCVQRVEDLLQVEEPYIKVSAYRKTGIDAATKSLRERYQDQLKIAISGDMWMDCMAPGVNKGAAVRLLQESLGILPKETMVFGDQMNDIEMMNQAYYSFAVGNARPEVKAAARFQTDRNVEDGVLKVLRLLVED